MSWFDWERAASCADLERFCAELLALRHRHPVAVASRTGGATRSGSTGATAGSTRRGRVALAGVARRRPVRHRQRVVGAADVHDPGRRAVAARRRHLASPRPTTSCRPASPSTRPVLPRRPPHHRHPRTLSPSEVRHRSACCGQPRGQAPRSMGWYVERRQRSSIQERQPASMSASSASSDSPYSMAWRGGRRWRPARSAHRPPHQARPAASRTRTCRVELDPHARPCSRGPTASTRMHGELAPADVAAAGADPWTARRRPASASAPFAQRPEARA